MIVEAETDILPIQCQLQKTALITANRIRVSSTIETIKILKIAGKRKYWKTRVSPLYKLEKIVKRKIGNNAYANIKIQVPIVTAL